MMKNAKRMLACVMGLALLAMLPGCGKSADTAASTASTPAPTATPTPSATATAKPTATATPAPEKSEAEIKQTCGHDEVNYVIVKAASCEAEGEAEYVCADCGEVLGGVALPATGHSYGYESDKDAHWQKCALCGKTTARQAHSFNDKSVCTVCGYGCEHDYTDTVVKPTCTEQGYTVHTCKLCGYSYTDTIVPAAGHSYQETGITHPTCTEAGRVEYTCSGCGDTMTTVLAATGHTPVTDAAEEATCQHTGKTEGSHCSVCGEVLTAQTVVPMKEHTVVVDPAEEATCQHTGKTEGSHCSVCGKVIKAQETVDQLDHLYLDGKCIYCGEDAPEDQQTGGFELPER